MGKREEKHSKFFDRKLQKKKYFSDIKIYRE